MTQPKFPTLSRRTLALLLAGFLLFLFILLNLPIAETLARLERDFDLVRSVTSRRRLVILLVAAVAAAIGAWALLRRQYKLLVAGAAALVLAGSVYLVYRFQDAYPHADLFSAERYSDNLRILLGRDVVLSKFDPRPPLVLEQRQVERAAYPAIDVHFHLESLPAGFPPERLISAMDASGVQSVVHLGSGPNDFEFYAEQYYQRYPDRIVMFVKPDAGALRRGDDVSSEVEWIRRAAAMGARGIKLSKSFGMSQRDASRKVFPVDDERWDPVWELAGRLGLPVLIHTGEPPAFWDPVDRHNERFPELLENPNWSLHGKADVPSLEELMAQREQLLARHPGTVFIGAHFGMNPEDLGYVAKLLDIYPNYYVDLSSVVQELGRQPYSTRRFFIEYQDRILFGTDGGYGNVAEGPGWTPERMFRSYFEFLETDNEYIHYPMHDVSKQGNWRVYGIHLPAEVLEKIYAGNAERLIPTAAEVRSRLAALGGG